MFSKIATRAAVLTPVLALAFVSAANATTGVDYTSVTTGLLDSVSGTVTSILPYLAGLMAIIVGWKYVRKFVGAKP